MPRACRTGYTCRSTSSCVLPRLVGRVRVGHDDGPVALHHVAAKGHRHGGDLALRYLDGLADVRGNEREPPSRFATREDRSRIPLLQMRSEPVDPVAVAATHGRRVTDHGVDRDAAATA